MRRRQLAVLGLGMLALGGLLLEATGCTPATTAITGSTGLVGTWKGKVTIVTTATSPGEEPNTTTEELDLTLTIDENGLPTGLPLFARPSGVEVTLFQVGGPYTQSGKVPLDDQGTTADTTITINVKEATFQETSFRVVYEIDYTLSTSNGSVNLNGTETYVATLNQDGSLAWSDNLDVDQTATETGQAPQTGTLTAVLTGDLTKQ